MEGVPKALLDTQPVSAPCPSFSICPFLRFPTWKTDGPSWTRGLRAPKGEQREGKVQKGPFMQDAWLTLSGAARRTACESVNEGPEPGPLISRSFITGLDALLQLVCETEKGPKLLFCLSL